MANPFAAFQNQQQAPAPQPGFAQPGYPQPQPQHAPQGFGPPAAPPQGFGAPQGFVHNLPAQLPQGIGESGGSDPMIEKPGSYLLEYDGHQLSAQSATLFVYFKIRESSDQAYPVGMRVKWLKAFKEQPGHWKWNKDAGWVLGLLRALTGFASEADFKASPVWASLGTTWEHFVLTVIRGEPCEALRGRTVRDEVTYQYDPKTGAPKLDVKRGTPFMNHSFRPTA